MRARQILQTIPILMVLATASAAAFGGAAVDGSVVYLPCTDGVRAVRVDDAGKLHVLWHATMTINGSPVVGGGFIRRKGR